ncbi:MAG TPA: hypothetical protein VK860_01895 [Ilumatobacteraceae bacterium]|nr:hypothetical protein [Ilumatobacteraceae bacterium]
MNVPTVLTSLLGGAAAVPVVDHEVWRIIRVEPTLEGSALRCTGPAGSVTVIVPVRPTAALAERWRRVVCVHRVDITLHRGDVAASITGVGHRLPSRRGVPVSVGLALVADGVPGRLLRAGEADVAS